MKNLYVFNVNTRGAMYGIGTYIEQLAKCSIKKDMNVSIVEIRFCATTDNYSELHPVFSERIRQTGRRKHFSFEPNGISSIGKESKSVF